MENRDYCHLTVSTQSPENEMALVSREKAVHAEFARYAPPREASLGDVLEKRKRALQIFISLRLTEIF